MRHRTGNAVMDIATAMKSIYVPKSIGTVPDSSWKSLYRPLAIAHPRPNGSAIPAAPTLTATFQLLTKYRRSTSRPTKKRNRMSPKLATRLRPGIAGVGKMACVKPGIRPMTEGPRRTPPSTSAITRGWRRRARG